MDGYRTHVQIIVSRAVGISNRHTVVPDTGNRPVFDGDGCMLVLVASRRTDILPLMAMAQRTHRCFPAACLAKVVPPWVRVIIRVALVPTRRSALSTRIPYLRIGVSRQLLDGKSNPGCIHCLVMPTGSRTGE